MRRTPLALLLVLLCSLPVWAAELAPPGAWARIRKARIQRLLPGAMERAGVDAWVVLCRENANDPLAAHIGCENAGAPAAFLFLRGPSRTWRASSRSAWPSWGWGMAGRRTRTPTSTPARTGDTRTPPTG